MKRIMPGLYDGERVRIERDGTSWKTEVKLRDCGALLGVDTGYYEGHDDGRWVHVGRYRTIRIAQRACDALFAGTHVFRSPYTSSSGKMPGQVVPASEANEAIAAATAPSP